MPTIRFSIGDKIVQADVARGETLLEAASSAGIQLNSICGGEGICGKCTVLVNQEELKLLEKVEIAEEGGAKPSLLACKTRVGEDLTVEIPNQSVSSGGKILIEQESGKLKSFIPPNDGLGLRKKPLVDKKFLELPEPSLKDNLSDQQRIFRELKRHGEDSLLLQTDLQAFKDSASLLRNHNWNVTTTLGYRKGAMEVTQLEANDKTNTNLGIALDIGTTTIVAHLIDLGSGETLATRAKYNSQIKYGEEITRRIRHVEEKGRKDLHQTLIRDCNDLIQTLINSNDANQNDITAVMCSGNTAMMHFFLDLEISNIRKKPYVPNATNPPPIKAGTVGLNINPQGLIYWVPAIGGWVGGDVTSGILTTGLHKSEKLTMLMDIGTNGEIVIGNKNWMISCAASAGPAFEGTGFQSGMRASEGAIEKVNNVDGQLTYSVIGNTRPRGICGSGLIDLIATLFQDGKLNRSGELLPESSKKIKEENGELKFVLVNPPEAEEGEIAVYQSEIENLISAKAAIYSGANILTKNLDLNINQVDRLYIAGGFGSYLDKEKSKVLGLIPDLHSDKIEFAGNTSIIGAKMALLSREAFEETQKITNSVTYYDLIDYPSYFDEFTAAKFIPHTNLEQFSSLNLSQN